jgi:hypothetical protein
LELFSHLHKLLTVLSDGDLHGLQVGIKEDLIVALILESNLVSIFIEVTDGVS